MLQFRNLRLEFRVCWCRASEGAVFFLLEGSSCLCSAPKIGQASVRFIGLSNYL